nr:hypothetical protein AVHM3334_23125 [Acidovorax sp. SUPP3334]
MQHYASALQFAFKAYSHGQSGSAYLADDLWLFDYARWDWECNNPLRTNFRKWLAPIANQFPGIGLESLLHQFDHFTPVDWFHIGDRASCVDGAFHLNAAYQTAQSRLDQSWGDAVIEVTKHAEEFRVTAQRRFEMNGILRIDYVDLGILTGLAGCAERILSSGHAGRAACVSQICTSWCTSNSRHNILSV